MKYAVKYVVTIVCTGFLCILSALAEPITEPQARNIASRSFGAISGQRTRGGDGEQLRLAYRQDAPSGQADLYVYTPANGRGFVVVAGDDCLPEVLGYSSNNRFSKDSIPPQLQAIFKQYGAFIKASAGKTLSSKAHNTRGGGAVDPLLGDLAWDQNAPYNEFTPTFNGKHSPTGCVATALAQIMRYHCWPPAGKGAGEYTIIGKKNSNQTVSIEGNTYNWSSMLNRYTDLSNKAANRAVARLMYDVGVAVKMSYGEHESAAYTANTAIALLENFQYNNSLRLMYRRYHTSKDWESTIQEELAAKRPIFYGGGSPQGGHAFVCDGYDGNGLYHINWGWSGHANGYYALIELLPGYQGTGSGGGGGYITDQDMIVGIQPNYVAAPPKPLIYAEMFTMAEGKYPKTSSIDATLSAFNYNGEPLSGKLGVMIFNYLPKIVKQFTATNGNKGMGLLYGPNDKSVTLSGLETLEPGIYYAFPVFYMADKDKWEVVRMPLNMHQFYILTIDANYVTVKRDNSHEVKLDATVNTTTLYRGQNFISVTYTNQGLYPYNGLIGVRLVSDPTYTAFDNENWGVYYTNSFIDPGQSVTFETFVNDATAYDMLGEDARYVQVLYDKTNQLYDPNDNLSHIPHHVLKSVPIALQNKTLELPKCKILSAIPSVCEQDEELTVEVSFKLDDDESYYSGRIALQFIQADAKGSWIRGKLGEVHNITCDGAEEKTITFKGKIAVDKGDYNLSVGLLKYNADEKRRSWYAASPYTPKQNDEVERPISVAERSVASPLPTLPIVIDLNNLNTTAVESNKLIPLNVHPNPATTELHIEASDGQPIELAALYSLAGHCVRRVEVTPAAPRTTIDVSQLPEGLYILRVNGVAKRLHGTAKVIVGGKRE